MDRRRFLLLSLSSACVAHSGCRGYQYGHIIKDDAPNMVGSHTAGSEVFDPLIEEAVAKLLGRQEKDFANAPCGPDGRPLPKTICFVCVENKSAEDLGDFKDMIYQQINTKIVQSDLFEPVSKRKLDAVLHETRLRPDSLMVPDNMHLFTSIMQRDGEPIDYFLYATLNSGSTERNSSTQRDYLLTLELVNIHSGRQDMENAKIRKGYHKSVMGKWWNYNPLKS